MISHRSCVVIFCLAIALSLSVSLVPGGASACCGPVMVDAGDASARAVRSSRGRVEGIWEMRLDYNPEPDTTNSYRIAIVRNEYAGVYPEAEYLGVAIAGGTGVARGEVKLLLNGTARKKEYIAVVITGKGFGRGTARLESGHTGSAGSVLNMKGVKFGPHVMTERLDRIAE